MISRINGGVNFTAAVIRNAEFQEGVKQAKQDARTDYRSNANEFVNAVKYLENDGTDDVYEVVKDDKRKNNYLLLKNGEYERNADFPKPGHSVMDLFKQYLLSKNVSVARPFTPAGDVRYELTNLHDNLENVREKVRKIESDEIEMKIDTLM